MDQPSRIYVFSNVKGGGDGIALAVGQDGVVLGSHWCSHEGWARHDLGVEPGSRPDRHVGYAEHFPGGYEMEFVPANEVLAHAGLAEAFRLNALGAPPECLAPPSVSHVKGDLRPSHKKSSTGKAKP